MSTTLGIRDGDLDFDGYGGTVKVTGQDKASQDLAQIQISSYNAVNGYGCRVVPGAVPDVAGEAFIATELTMTVGRLQAKQQNLDTTTDDERITAISQLSVSGAADKVSFSYYLAVQTGTGASVSTSNNVTRRHVSLAQLGKPKT
jgi:hypothetical protein